VASVGLKNPANRANQTDISIITQNMKNVAGPYNVFFCTGDFTTKNRYFGDDTGKDPTLADWV
jgi:calcineurin-like phosphoesterase family protein